MKGVLKVIVGIVLITAIVMFMKVEPDAVMSKITGGAKAKIIEVNSYSKFYNAISSCILNKQGQVSMRISGYNGKSYDVSKAVMQVMAKNPNLRYIIENINMSGTTRGKTATINYYFRYLQCDYVVNNFSGIINSLSDAVKKHKENVRIRINNYNESYSLQNIYDKLSSIELPYRYDFGASTISGLSEFKDKAFELNIIYSNTSDNTVPDNNITNVTDTKEIYDKIKEAMKMGESVLTFQTKNASQLTFNDFNDIVDKVINDNSEYRYFNHWNTASSTIGSNATYKLELSLNFTKDKIQGMENAVDQKVKAIVASVIKSGMNDYEKELKLHDYLVNNAHYDYDNFLKDTIPNGSYTAYGVLVNGVGVCEGYSYAMKRLLDAVGIESHIITGNVSGEFSGPHAWNIVKLGNEYYHLDATFDDPIVNNGSRSILSHEYFNLTDAEIKKNHSWDISKFPKCNGSTYKYKN